MLRSSHPADTAHIRIVDPELIAIHQELGIADDYAEKRGLPPFYQAPLDQLVVCDIDREGRPFVLQAAAATAWRSLVAASEADGVKILAFSGFRSYVYQKGLILKQLEKGRTLEDVFTSLAVPGYSEHHTGRAIDLMTPGCKVLSEDLEATDAYRWLTQHAGTYGFVLSFPRNNPYGFIYEPWHWCFHPPSEI